MQPFRCMKHSCVTLSSCSCSIALRPTSTEADQKQTQCMLNCCVSDLTTCAVAALSPKPISLASLASHATSASLDRLTCTGTYCKVTVLTQRGDTCCIMPSTLLQQVPVQRQQLHSLFYAGGEAAAGQYLLSQGLFGGAGAVLYVLKYHLTASVGMCI